MHLAYVCMMSRCRHVDEHKKGNLMQTILRGLTANWEMLVHSSLHLILDFIGIMFLTNQGKSENYNVHSHINTFGTQHSLLLVRLVLLHQSMLIRVTLSVGLRVQVPTVGGI